MCIIDRVITAHSKKDEEAQIDYTLLTDESMTCIFLMGLAHVEHIAEELIRAGRRPDTPVAVSYTHLDVYKRQLLSFAFSPFMSTTGIPGAIKAIWISVGCRMLIGIAAGWLWICLLYTSQQEYQSEQTCVHGECPHGE